ncbi:ADP-ribosylglycohydrolase family protein [Saccharopolyspora flava]|uniref:ADP-ribosylglycohydrolase n=1 Tax=Saccharopolyspora flava TaxID=95161 RepID=A0A1I6TVC6_9PSEU|nr:ADP-ribosylglycohydrolase family protein [Saccharopolyspora flava]SFS93114.1 ADP-ribosylglycohydrolase [Saccharopolyspora flava]
MEKAEAIELVERWLRAQGLEIGVPGGRKVEPDGVRLSAEGWRVPFNTTEAVDTGNHLEAIVPFPMCVVTEPDGELRLVNTTPYPGFSTPLTWPGEPRRSEIIDPEYKADGFFGMGVPKNKVAGWKITHPDGTTEDKVNPEYKPGPQRAGLPKPANHLEKLLNYVALKHLPHRNVVFGMMRCDILIPGEPDSPPEQRLVMNGYSSPRHMPQATTWWRMTIATFADRYPGSGLAINSQSWPSMTIKGSELTEVYEHMRQPHTVMKSVTEGIKPGEVVFEEEPGLSDAWEAKRTELQQRFGLEHPPSITPKAIVEARASGHGMTPEEQERHLLGRAWVSYNVPRTTWSQEGRAADDISGQEWPADLRANGLVVRHDPIGRVRPLVDFFGKVPHVGGSDPVKSWHSVVGAYVGFALGEALGAAVDGLTWPQIQQRYGPHGIPDMQTVFERPVQSGWLTQWLMFITEGAVRGAKRGDVLSPEVMRSAFARWLVTQGMPWQQAAGPLAGDHPQPDGWLLRVPEMHVHRGASPQLIEVVRAAVADPAQSTLTGPLQLIWALPGAVAETDLAASGGFNRTGVDDGATYALRLLFQRMFRKETVPNPIWLDLRQVIEENLQAKTSGEAAAAETIQDVNQRWKQYFVYDIDLVEGIGNGTDTLSVLGRAVFAAARREYDPEMALKGAVNHSGNSALTGALAGAVLGARLGVAGLPSKWVDALDTRDLLEELADHAYWHFAIRNPHRINEKDWNLRYPAW